MLEQAALQPTAQVRPPPPCPALPCCALLCPAAPCYALPERGPDPRQWPADHLAEWTAWAERYAARLAKEARPAAERNLPYISLRSPLYLPISPLYLP